MTETVHFHRVLRADLDLGNGTRTLRLADGSLHTLQQIHGHVLISQTVSVSASNVAQLTATFSNPAGSRLYGIVTKISSQLTNGNGLTGIDIGDSVLLDRFGRQSTLTTGAETDSSDFNDADIPIVSAGYQALLTAIGGNFENGSIDVQMYYSLLKFIS